MGKSIGRWLPAILVAGIIFALSSQSGATVSSNGDVDYLAHETAHFVIFSILCLAFYRATKSVFFSMILTILYGVSDELHQQFVPGRNGNLIDIAVDTFAAFFVGGILWKYYAKIPKKLKNWLEE